MKRFSIPIVLILCLLLGGCALLPANLGFLSPGSGSNGNDTSSQHLSVPSASSTEENPAGGTSPNGNNSSGTVSDGAVSDGAASSDAALSDEHQDDSGKAILRYYYDQLTPAQKEIYQQIVTYSEAFQGNIPVDRVSSDDASRAVFAARRDRPDLYWIDSYQLSLVNDQVLEVIFQVPADASDVCLRTEAAAKELIDGMPDEIAGGSAWDQAKYLYDRIIIETDYNFSANDQDAAGVLLDHAAVCAGYTAAFQYLCQMAGIDCTTIVGRAKEGRHAWNMIWLDGVPYWVDITWGDPVYSEGQVSDTEWVDYNYFCVTDAELFATHAYEEGASDIDILFQADFTFPACTDTSLNYYRQKGCFFEGVRPEATRAYLESQFRNGTFTDIELKFDSAEGLNAFFQTYFAGDFTALSELLEPYRESSFADGYSCLYEPHEEECYIRFSIVERE